MQLTLQQNIKQGIEGRPVTWYDEIFDLVFPNLDREAANKCRVCEWAQEHKGEAKAEHEEGRDE